jgi:hypothetical protein
VLFSYPSAEGKEFYLRAVNALTPQAVATIEDEMDEKTSVYLNKTASHEQYPACARYMRGNTTSGIAESLNNANMKVRQSDLFPALVALVEESQKRFHACQQKGRTHVQNSSPAQDSEKDRRNKGILEKVWLLLPSCCNSSPCNKHTKHLLYYSSIIVLFKERMRHDNAS